MPSRVLQLCARPERTRAGLGGSRAGAGGIQSHAHRHSSSLLFLSQAIIQAIHAIRQLDEETLHRALRELAEAIGDMSTALGRMHGNSGPRRQGGTSSRRGARVCWHRHAHAWPLKPVWRDGAAGDPPRMI